MDSAVRDIPSLAHGIGSGSTLHLYDTLSILQSICYDISFLKVLVLAATSRLKTVPFFIPSTFKRRSVSNTKRWYDTPLPPSPIKLHKYHMLFVYWPSILGPLSKAVQRSPLPAAEQWLWHRLAGFCGEGTSVQTMVQQHDSTLFRRYGLLYLAL